MPKTGKLNDSGIESMLLWTALANSINRSTATCMGKAEHRIYISAQSFVSPLQNYPDLQRMDDAQYADFRLKCELLDWQKEELRHGDHRNDRYQEMVFWHRLKVVADSYMDFRRYFVSKGIFI